MSLTDLAFGDAQWPFKVELRKSDTVSVIWYHQFRAGAVARANAIADSHQCMAESPTEDGAHESYLVDARLWYAKEGRDGGRA